MALENWDFDFAHSDVSFWVRHMMISKVHGRFASWKGTLALDTADLSASRVEVTVDVGSIDTKEPQRDAHLRSADFLDTEKFPHLTFKSTGVEKHGDNELRLTGDLTIRDVTRKVTLEVDYAGRQKDPWGGERVGFSAKTSFDRKDFGLTWNKALEAGGILIGDKVEIAIEIEALKPQPKSA